MEITVIDDRWGDGFFGSAAGPATALFRVGEVTMTSAENMVDNVLAKAGGAMISRLNIYDHGNPHGIQLGSDWISNTTLPQHRATLARLAGHFRQDAIVYLYHCDAGQNERLMRRLAGIFGTRVYAGTGLTLGPLGLNFGQQRRCNEDNCWDPPRPPSPWDNPNKVCCFPADTLVHTPDGTVPIQSLKTGDAVLAWDAEKTRVVPEYVLTRDDHVGVFPIRSLGSKKSLLHVTDTHRFAGARDGWIAVENIRPGFIATTLEGRSIIRDVRQNRVAARCVFNLRLNGLHNYFVGLEGILVRDH